MVAGVGGVAGRSWRVPCAVVGTVGAPLRAPGGQGPDGAAACDLPCPTDPWVATTPDGYLRFAVPGDVVDRLVGGAVTVEVEGAFGPGGAWAALALDRVGGAYRALLGVLAPGGYAYRYVATTAERAKVAFLPPGDAPTDAVGSLPVGTLPVGTVPDARTEPRPAVPPAVAGAEAGLGDAGGPGRCVPGEGAAGATLPRVGPDGVVTFETGPQWAGARDVAVWGNWAPNGAWLRIPMTRAGDRWRLTLGPLDGFHYYRYVVDGVDVKDPADTATHLTSSSPLLVPRRRARLLADAPEGERGTLTAITYRSTVTGLDRPAYVWTPPGHDPRRPEPYPVLVLNHGGGQCWGDWVETGRAAQILDNLHRAGAVEPMVVVMPDGTVPCFDVEILDSVLPAAVRRFHASEDPARRAIVGLSMGGMRTVTTWLAHPGEFAWVAAFSGFVFGRPRVDAAAVNAGTRLARFYTGDVSDFTRTATMAMLAWLEECGVGIERADVTPGPHGFDTWQANLVDLLPRLFRTAP